MLVSTLFGDFVNGIVGPGADHDDQHGRFGTDELVDDAQPGITKLDLQQAGEVGAAFAAKRFAVTALVDGNGILHDLVQSFCDQKLLISGELFEVLLGLRQEFQSPVHSNSTSSMLSSAALVMPFCR